MQSFIVFASVLACASAGVLYSGLAPGLTSSQFHAQDELGQYSYGYAGGPSAKSESKDAFGNVRGSYSYIDANNIQQTVNYVADPVNGFRVAATNLPVGPVAAPVAYAASAPVAYAAGAPVVYAAGHPVAQITTAPGGVVHVAALPQQVQDTPEVTLAKIQHFAAHNEAAARSG